MGKVIPSDSLLVSVLVDIVGGQALVARRAVDLIPDLAFELSCDGLAKAIAAYVGVVSAVGCDFASASSCRLQGSETDAAVSLARLWWTIEDDSTTISPSSVSSNSVVHVCYQVVQKSRMWSVSTLRWI